MNQKTYSFSIPNPKEISQDIEYLEADLWYVCGSITNVPQGWKLYVSCSILNAKDIIGNVGKLLSSHNVHFKYIKDIPNLQKLNSGLYGYSQIGKCLVIYLDKPEEKLITQLKTILEEFKNQSPIIPFAKQFGDDLPLYYRYGSFLDREFITINGIKRKDNRRDPNNAVPDGVQDDIARFTSPALGNKSLNNFLLFYPTIEALVQRGKSGVFKAFNLHCETYEEVVLKVAYPCGEVLPNSSDGRDLLRHSYTFYKQLERYSIESISPRLIDYYDDHQWVVVVIEYFEGLNLCSKLLSGELTSAHLDSCWSIINTLHSHGLILGDAKIANFLVNKNNTIKVIDFEGSKISGEGGDLEDFKTFQIFKPSICDSYISDKVHFLISVLYSYNYESISFSSRQIDLDEYLALTPQNETQEWAISKLIATLNS
jgi:hypothetical protein